MELDPVEEFRYPSFSRFWWWLHQVGNERLLGIERLRREFKLRIDTLFGDLHGALERKELLKGLCKYLCVGK